MNTAAIDTYVEAQMRRLKIPGAALAIVEGARVTYRRGYGRAHPGGDAPGPETPFALGSTTKSFTALAVMQLAEAGRIELDAPVRRYLPWFRVADPQASARMTVRHLLNQTSGMSMVAGTACLADLDDSPEAREGQARGLSTLELNHAVGESFQYCNLNYNVLGLVIEAVSEQSYADYVQDHISAPLDMSRTHASLDRAERDGLATGHRYWFGMPVPATGLPFPRGPLAAGGLVSTAEDLTHYVVAQLSGGRYDGPDGSTQILSSAGIEEMHREVAEQRFLGSTVATYGMGWFVSEVGGTTLVSHGGNVPDFSSFIGLLPERKKGVVLLTNSDHGLPMILTEVGEGLAALVAGREPPPIRFGFFPWTMRALPLAPLLQGAGAMATLRSLDRWNREPVFRPSGGRLWGRQILLPLAPNLAPAALLVLLRRRGLLPYLRLYMPDLAWLLTICGGFAALWSVASTVLKLLSSRRGARV